MDAIKLNAILKSMEEQNLPQMIISDPPSIFYLTGKWIHPGERCLALYLNVNGDHKLVINKLFPQEKDLGVELVWYDDIEDAVEILSQFVEKDKPIGIDKTWPARFLLPLQERCPELKTVWGSDCVDNVRACKNAEEIQIMKEASEINDNVMLKVENFIKEGMTEKEACKKIEKQHLECNVKYVYDEEYEEEEEIL